MNEILTALAIFALIIVCSYVVRWFLGIGRLIEEQERTNVHLSSMSSTMRNIERLLKKLEEELK